MTLRDFVRNYDDLSNDSGYQFKFKCDICQDGFLTKFRDAPGKGFRKAGHVLGAVGGVGSSLGGRFGSAWGAQSAAGHMESYQHDAKWNEEHDKALDEAIAEARGHFTKCPGCNKYVDANCWNEQVQLCTDDAPRQTVTVQKARAQAFGAAAQQAMNAQDYSAEIKGAEEAKILCPTCGKPTSSGKFCEACGAPLSKFECPTCGAKLSSGARFCNNCGTKLS